MIKVLPDVLPHVKLQDSLDNPIVLEGKKYKIVGIRPRPTNESRKILIEKCVTLGDLFYLEPPRTFSDLQWRADHYKLDIDLNLEEE